MCGIFGFINTAKTHTVSLNSISDLLFRLSDSRGKEASGIAVANKDEVIVYRRPIRGSELIKTSVYKMLYSKNVNVFIGHSRLATNGLSSINKNNQPLFNDTLVLVHNGVVVNDKEIWKRVLKKTPKLSVDTEVMLNLIDKNQSGMRISLVDSVKYCYSIIEGSASIAVLSALENRLVLATNTGSLYFSDYGSTGFVFASEKYILKRLFDLTNKKACNNDIVHLEPGKGMSIDLNNLRFEHFSLTKRTVPAKITLTKRDFSIHEMDIGIKPFQIRKIVNSISALRKHNFDYSGIYSLRRCTKCVLPETMPNIVFDNSGVCNYCLKQKKISYLGKRKLEEILSKYRKYNSKPDCLLAFSGGRDSSYGLHYLKKVMHMNPVAYTYDWGMVTDLARRNQARMLGKLGIEHIVYSADISQKRSNIRRNINAWMKRPELGMVPLFMAGDKQNEFYADRVAKHLGVDLVIYCSGCGMENDIFKAGLAGIKDPYPAGILHNMPVAGRLKMLIYYLTQFIKNPAYINPSILDTAFGYFSTYIKRHKYLYFWYFIPWNEQKITTTLINNYGWETDPKTNLTWRTDDGSPAFYNYIYYQTLGLTENDTFRSNQIREGQLTRSQAISMIHDENKPRYSALKWYFDSLEMDGNLVLSLIDRIPKNY